MLAAEGAYPWPCSRCSSLSPCSCFYSRSCAGPCFRMDNENGRRTGSQDLLSNAANQKIAYTAAAVGREHDEVIAELFCMPYYTTSNVAFRRLVHVTSDVYALLAQPPLYPLEVCPGFSRAGQVHFAMHPGRSFLFDYMDEGNVRLQAARQMASGREDCLRQA